MHVDGFDEVISIDFEFVARDGERPEVVCMVARELNSGHQYELFGNFPPAPPFRTDAGVLFVGFFLSAEWSCFLELGWPLPACTIDVFVEHRVDRNGIELPHEHRSLLDAARFHGLLAMTKDEKGDMRDLILRGGPWTGDERRAIVRYCGEDVLTTAAVFSRQLPAIEARYQGIGRAMLRGEAMKAVAHMERAGIPIDVALFDQLRQHWDGLRLDLITRVDHAYGVFENGEMRRGLFAAYLAHHHIPWPRTPTGLLQLDGDTFKDQARVFPQLHPLRELLHSLGELRLFDLAVGADGRNRTLLSPFRARTGRNQPSNKKFIFGPSTRLRGLITPPPGRALAYVDWSSQEVAIVAALSGDEVLLAAVASGDVYLDFAQRAGLAPAGATKESHGAIRDACKVLVLSMNYGMSAPTLAARLGIGMAEAHGLQRSFERVYPRATRWLQEQIWTGTLHGSVETVLGWPMHGTFETRSTVLRNFPAQGHGAELLRLACAIATRRGVTVCAPIHDALLVEGPVDEIDHVVWCTRQARGRASNIVLDGFEIATDVKLIRPPDRYTDGRGKVMWDEVMGLLARRVMAA
jgi:hypothetical protein